MASPLQILSWLWLAGGVLAALAVAAHVWRHRPKMAVMIPVWIITPLYFGAPGWWLYRWLTQTSKGPVFRATLHCGAGCTLGDILAESASFSAGITDFAARLGADFVAAFAFGLIFQYFSIAPMRGLGLRDGLKAAFTADAASLTAFQAGMFLWMAATQCRIPQYSGS